MNTFSAREAASVPFRLAPLTLALAALALTTSATCQGTTWTVDPLNGPGTDFTSLDAAEAAASNGDILLVRAGSYSGFSTSKGITILGDKSIGVRPMFFELSGDDESVRIHNIAAGTSFRMENVVVSALNEGGGFFGSDLIAGLRVENCAGNVHFEEVEISSLPTDESAGISLQDSANVSFSSCDIQGNPGVIDRGMARSTFVNSNIQGKDTILLIAGATIPASHGIRFSIESSDSEMRLVNTNVTGGRGLFNQAGRPAIALGDAILQVSGDASTEIRGDVVQPAIGVPTFGNSPGTITIDPAVVLAGSVPVIDPIHSTTVRDIPALTATGGGPGGDVTYELLTTPMNSTFILLGLPASPVATPFGLFELDPVAVTPLFTGAQPPSGVQTQTLTVPSDPNLQGQVFGVQAGVFRAQAGVLELTNAAKFILF